MPESGDTVEYCVGCGAAVPRIQGPIHPYMTSAPGCWALHGELSAHLLGDPQALDYRQLCVDAYAIQHPGGPNRRAIQSVAVHLISLYAQLERGLPGPAAPGLIHRALQGTGRYRWLPPPSFEGARTVGHVLTQSGHIATAAREWAGDAWHAWNAHHRQVQEWYGQVVKG